MNKCRKGITFIEILAALIIFSTVVAATFVVLQDTRHFREQAAKENKARDILDEWLQARDDDEPVDDEIIDDDTGWMFTVVDETTKDTELDLSDEELQAVLQAPDLNTAMQLLGVQNSADDLGAEDKTSEESENAEEVDLDAPLLNVKWGVIRVEASPPSGESSENIVSWHFITDLSMDQTIASLYTNTSTGTSDLRQAEILQGVGTLRGVNNNNPGSGGRFGRNRQGGKSAISSSTIITTPGSTPLRTAPGRLRATPIRRPRIIPGQNDRKRSKGGGNKGDNQ